MSAPTDPGWWLRVAASIAPAGIREHVESVFEYDGELWFHDPYRIPKVQPVGDHAWVGEMVISCPHGTRCARCEWSRGLARLGFEPAESESGAGS